MTLPFPLPRSLMESLTFEDSPTYRLALSVAAEPDMQAQSWALVDGALSALADLPEGASVEPMVGTWQGDREVGVVITSQTGNPERLFDDVARWAESIGAEMVHASKGTPETKWWDIVEHRNALRAAV